MGQFIDIEEALMEETENLIDKLRTSLISWALEIEETNNRLKVKFFLG
jgi:hypothetical protein